MEATQKKKKKKKKTYEVKWRIGFKQDKRDGKFWVH